MFTEAGDALVANRLSGATSAAVTHMAIGDGSGQTTADTTLDSELGRVALTSTTQGTSGDDNDVVYVATFPAGTGTGTITEVALFNAGAGGTMMLYLDGFTAVEKDAGQSLTVDITVTWGLS